VMTTNYVDKLDEALIRLGCVDLRVEFELADKEVIG
jgi:ATP-dependent 26S proteasome regulatory subunit